MAQTPEEIAKDIVVAWVAQSGLKAGGPDHTKQHAEVVGEFYKIVAKAVREAFLSP